MCIDSNPLISIKPIVSQDDSSGKPYYFKFNLLFIVKYVSLLHESKNQWTNFKSSLNNLNSNFLATLD